MHSCTHMPASGLESDGKQLLARDSRQQHHIWQRLTRVAKRPGYRAVKKGDHMVKGRISMHDI